MPNQTLLPVENSISIPSGEKLHKEPGLHAATPMIFGLHKKVIKVCIWINIVILALYIFKNPVRALKAVKKLAGLRDSFRDNHIILKYAKVGSKYYYTFNAPAWPSKAFNNYVSNNLKKIDTPFPNQALDTVLFGITKKCGYQCEHCFEWDALNKPETLSRENILSIIHSFQKLGITQVQLSGGEPLNRFDDILYVLQNIKRGTDVWLYTSGYHFTEERASLLKHAGLTGITVSLDHWVPELHNIFRGKNHAFEWAEKAVANATKQNLVVCLSLCATKEFISKDNLLHYANLAKRWGAAFIQVLEPKAVGHYAEKDVCLHEKQLTELDDFFTAYNFNKNYNDYPSVIYHGFYSRRTGCGGGGKHYVYVDTDGDVHNCPFCQKKIFSALNDPIEKNLNLMRQNGCNAFINPSKKVIQ
jgi:MoaA/NifB/PqqE/SkfB family radical SAM enzyme